MYIDYVILCTYIRASFLHCVVVVVCSVGITPALREKKGITKEAKFTDCTRHKNKM
jgi:hypothetical protein